MRSDQVLTNEQQKQQGQQVKESWAQKLQQWVQDNHAQQPALGAELAAMGREAIKDVRGTLMEIVFREARTRLGTGNAPIAHDAGSKRQSGRGWAIPGDARHLLCPRQRPRARAGKRDRAVIAPLHWLGELPWDLCWDS